MAALSAGRTQSWLRTPPQSGKSQQRDAREVSGRAVCSGETVGTSVKSQLREAERADD